MRTAKISIAIDKTQLRLARKAAKYEGLSLSAYIGRALSGELANHERINAARLLHEAWGEESLPTAEDRERFVSSMSRARRRRATAA